MSDHVQLDSLIQRLKESDIDSIASNFALHHWPKPRAIFDKYLKDQGEGTRIIWVASEKCGDHQKFARYVTLTWHSLYKSFQKLNIPEIMDD